MFVTLGVEDALSETVASRLISEYVSGAEVVSTMGLTGYDYLKRNIRNCNQIARYKGPVLVLTDLDRPESCPVELIREWIGDLRIASNLLIRVAVLEVESWIMADRRAFTEWLGIAQSRASRWPEELPDPKRFLIELALRSRKHDLRAGLVRSYPDGLHDRGPGYNALLSEFVTELWNPEIARSNAPSLDRAIRRIAEMERNVSS